MVFDTTASNTGSGAGACTLLEDWLGFPILWLACMHHVHELHLAHAMKEIFGETKDPGVALFCRLKSEWQEVVKDINYDELKKLDMDSLPEWMQFEARDVLIFLNRCLEENTFPRADYRELLELGIIFLGGSVQNFRFRQPGADHHARWMSKIIYSLKLHLLSGVFDITAEESLKVEEFAVFGAVFYLKSWFQCTLPTMAARNTLSFMENS